MKEKDTNNVTREQKEDYIYNVFASKGDYKDNETHKEFVYKLINTWSEEKVDKLWKDHFGADMRIAIAIGNSFIKEEVEE